MSGADPVSPRAPEIFGDFLAGPRVSEQLFISTVPCTSKIRERMQCRHKTASTNTRLHRRLHKLTNRCICKRWCSCMLLPTEISQHRYGGWKILPALRLCPSIATRSMKPSIHRNVMCCKAKLSFGDAGAAIFPINVSRLSSAFYQLYHTLQCCSFNHYGVAGP